MFGMRCWALTRLHSRNLSVDKFSIPTDHQILLSRLNSVLGIQSTALQWFQSYLSDRYQSTSVSNSSSSPSQLMYSVPQGSVLGPILFVLYTTPLSNIIANHSVNDQLFVDNTQLQKSAPLSEVTNLIKELDACTDDIKTWMTENQLKLNNDKTEALLFHSSSSLKSSTISLPDSITLGSHNIPFPDSARNTGITLKTIHKEARPKNLSNRLFRA